MRIKSILLLFFLIFSVGIIPAQNCKKEDTYTPEKGTDERNAILDALREKICEMHNINVIFVMHYLKVYNGWAWVHTLPQDANGTNHYEDLLALIRKEDKHWIVLEIPCAEEDNPDCITSEDYYRGLIKRHPGIPECILPIE